MIENCHRHRSFGNFLPDVAVPPVKMDVTAYAVLAVLFFSISKSPADFLGNLPAVWDCSDEDKQQSFLTARTRAEGWTLKIDPEPSWGFRARCSLTRPRKHGDKGDPGHRLILLTYDSAGPSAPPPLSSFIHLPLYRFIFHIRVGVWRRVCADAAIVLEAVCGNRVFFLFFYTFCDPVKGAGIWCPGTKHTFSRK